MEKEKFSGPLRSLSASIGAKETANAEKFLHFLSTEIEKKRLVLENTRILVGYGGGKDSTWALAFTRLAQLLCREKYCRTFKIKAVTMVHLGVPKQVLLNIDRVYARLGLYNDADCELKIFCYGHKADFSKDYEIPKSIRDLLRTDILLSGHRCCGNPRGTFCISCNLHLVSAALSYMDEEIDFILTGDSLAEAKQYWGWLSDVFLRLRIRQNGFGNRIWRAAGMLTKLNYLFFRELLSDADHDIIYRLPPASIDDNANPALISIFDFTDYDCGTHWNFLTRSLGFKFYPESLNFTESDCQHPLLMAHLRGLTAELQGRGYEDGIREYLVLANYLMKKKQFPEQLTRLVNARYRGRRKIGEMRRKAVRYSEETLDITEGQLKCMILSPFTNKGKNLPAYLKACAPELLGELDTLHAYLSGVKLGSDAQIADFLETTSGLKKEQLLKLYSSKGSNGNDLFQVLLASDPHKKEITFSSGGKTVKEVIFGR